MKKVSGVLGQATNFIKQVKIELYKVQWPDFQEFVGATAVTFILVLFFAVYIFFVDQGVNFVIQHVL